MGKAERRASASAVVGGNRANFVLPRAGQNTRTILLAGVFALVASVLFAFPAQAQPAKPSTSTPVSAAPDKATKPAKPLPPVAWKKIPNPEQKVLAPLEKDWGNMSGAQQRKLVTAAKEYPKLSPVEQERFQQRLKAWSTLTPEQRTFAREKYQSLRNLPPEKQHELKARWQEKSTAEQTAATPASPSK
jgi:Protein of unknown function (DUF3106)